MMFCFLSPLCGDELDFSSEFKILKNNTFYRTSPEIQLKCRQWADKFKSRYGEKVFDSLIKKFIETSTYKSLSKKAKVLQEQESARILKKKIQMLASEVPILWSRYRRLENKIRLYPDFSPGARGNFYRTLAINEAMEAYKEYNKAYLKHNQLVAEYNQKYLGSLDFFTDHLEDRW